MTQSKTNFIRDFIYLDVDRLYSLYSQVFEGVADKIVNSYIDSLKRKEKNSWTGNLEEEVGELSNRTESKVLYDHMYNKLEEKLNNSILEIPKNISIDNYQQILSNAFMIKVSGDASIQDYERAKLFMEKVNVLGEAIAHSAIVSGNFKSLIEALTIQINQMPDKNEQAKAKNQLSQQIKKFNDPKKLAQELGLNLDEKMLNYLNYFIEIFYPNGYEIIITPNIITENVVFRGGLDKEQLRINPNLLRTLYGVSVNLNLTMVGHISLVPKFDFEISQTELTPTSFTQQINNNNQEKSIRDSFTEIFQSMKNFESFFIESKRRVEVVIHPLAIYREVVI